MQKVQLMDFIFFSDGELCFLRFLPIGKENSLTFSKDSIDYEIYLEPEYKETFTFKPDFQNIDKSNHWVRALRINIYFDVDDETKRAIDNQNPPNELISKLASCYSFIENRIRDICRNDLGQYWLSHPYHHPDDKDRDILGGLHFINKNSGMGKQFLLGSTVRLDSIVPNTNILIDKEKWEKLGILIKRDYRPDLALVCLSNAKSLYQGKNHRLALIEAVIALERSIFSFIELYLDPEDTQIAQGFLKEGSVYDATKNLLPMVGPRLGIDTTRIVCCCNAIEKRNEIIHRTRFRLEEESIGKYISCLEYVILKIVPHQF